MVVIHLTVILHLRVIIPLIGCDLKVVIHLTVHSAISVRISARPDTGYPAGYLASNIRYPAGYRI